MAAGRPDTRSGARRPPPRLPECRAAERSAEVPESRTAEPGYSSESSLNPESSRRPSPVHARAALAAASFGQRAGDASMPRPFVAIPLDAGATLLIEGSDVGVVDTAALRAAAGPLLAYLTEAGPLPGRRITTGSHTVTTSAVPDAVAPCLLSRAGSADGTTTLPLTAVEIEAEIRARSPRSPCGRLCPIDTPTLVERRLPTRKAKESSS